MPVVVRRRHVRRVSLAAVIFGVAIGVWLVVGAYFSDGPGSPGAHDPVTASHCGLSGWLNGLRELAGRPMRASGGTEQDFICDGRGPKTVAENWQVSPCEVLLGDRASEVAGYVIVAAASYSKATCTYSSAHDASQFVVWISADGGKSATATATSALAKHGAVQRIGGLGDRAAGGAGVVVAQAGTTVLRITETVRGAPATPTQVVPIMKALLVERCVPFAAFLTPDCP